MSRIDLFKKGKEQKGQSLVEMTLGTVILVFILSGVLDFGRAYFTFIAMEDAVGEAALYFAIDPDCPDDSGGGVCTDPNNAESRAQDVANVADNLIDWADPTTILTVSFYDDPDTVGVDGDYDADTLYDEGEVVQVSLQYNFELYTPIVSQIVGDDLITLRTDATQTIVVGGDKDP